MKGPVTPTEHRNLLASRTLALPASLVDFWCQLTRRDLPYIAKANVDSPLFFFFPCEAVDAAVCVFGFDKRSKVTKETQRKLDPGGAFNSQHSLFGSGGESKLTILSPVRVQLARG